MANLFRVDLPDGMSSVKLDSKRRATVQYTVTNMSAREIDGRAVLISLPISKPPSGPVEKGWVKLEGKTDQHFGRDTGTSATFPVTISVPEKADSGRYSFRLDTVSVDKPDEGDQGPAVSFDVPKPDGSVKKFPLWLIPVIVVVLAAIGVGIYFLIPTGIKVPDLHGKTVDEATTALTAAKLTLDPNVETVQGKPEDANKVVDQKPAAGEKAKENDPVHLKVGATTAPPGGQTSFAANWVNDNTSTPSLTKLLITQSGDLINVHAYGKCSPTDCDWGTQRGTVASGTATATVQWNQGFVTRTMTLSLDSPGHLRSVMDSVYNDGRAPQHWVDTFHIGSAPYTPPGTPGSIGSTTGISGTLTTTTLTTTGSQTPFVANWVNDNASTPSLTKLLITQSGDLINVHAYGKCSPTDCDWGTQRGTVVKGSNTSTATIKWNQGFVTRTMTLSVDSTGRLRSVTDSVYNDSRAPQRWVETFHKT